MKEKKKQHPIYKLQIGGEITMLFNVYLGDPAHTFTLLNRESCVVLLKCGSIIYNGLVKSDRQIILTHAFNINLWEEIKLPAEISLRTGEFVFICDPDYTYEYSKEDEEDEEDDVISGPLSA